MTSHTVSLERSAYERLKAAHRPGESFSVAVNRILEGTRPSFRSLAGLITVREAHAVRRAVDRMRRIEGVAERRRFAELERAHGRDARH